MLFKEKSIYFSCGEVAEAEDISYRIYEVPEARVEFIGVVRDVTSFALAVKGSKDTYYFILGYILTLEGVIAPYNIDVPFLTDNSMEHVAIVHPIKHYVVLLKGGVRLLEYDHISMGFKQGVHTRASGERGVSAVGGKLCFGGAYFSGVRNNHSIIPAEVSFSQKASISRSAISLSTS